MVVFASRSVSKPKKRPFPFQTKARQHGLFHSEASLSITTEDAENVAKMFFEREDVKIIQQMAEESGCTRNRLLNQVTLDYLQRVTGLSV